MNRFDAGHMCTPEDIEAYYGTHAMDAATSTVSPYCNSAIAGTPEALADVIPRLLQVYASKDPKGSSWHTNDMLAVTYLSSGKLQTPGYRVIKDTRQALIGSLAYAKPFANLPANALVHVVAGV